MPTISRRLASEGTADPSDLRSLSLPGASPGSPTMLRAEFGGQSVEFKSPFCTLNSGFRTWKSPHADQFWNVNRTSEPGLGANECVPPGKWRKPTAFRQPLQAASMRTKFKENRPSYKRSRTGRVPGSGALPDARTNLSP